ncbi:MAG: hypothetical protein ACTS5F_00905 [Candidatus Hodgkinia cicadicola]
MPSLPIWTKIVKKSTEGNGNMPSANCWRVPLVDKFEGDSKVNEVGRRRCWQLRSWASQHSKRRPKEVSEGRNRRRRLTSAEVKCY